jgi:hypothetical protein
MDIHGHPWFSMGIHGCPWAAMVFHGHPWISMGIHGFPMASMDIRGDPWFSMFIYGYPWASMVFQIWYGGNVDILMTISKVSDFSQEMELTREFQIWTASQVGNIWRSHSKSCLCYEFPAETRLTVYRRLDTVAAGS